MSGVHGTRAADRDDAGGSDSELGSPVGTWQCGSALDAVKTHVRP